VQLNLAKERKIYTCSQVNGEVESKLPLTFKEAGNIKKN
jgi:hypothetical protein